MKARSPLGPSQLGDGSCWPRGAQFVPDSTVGELGGGFLDFRNFTSLCGWQFTFCFYSNLPGTVIPVKLFK